MAVLSAFSSVGASGPSMSATDFVRSNFIAAGDRVRSGLGVTFYAGRTVRVNAGTGVVGGVPFEVTASADLISDAETSTNPRLDRLVARRLWPSLQVELAIVKGAPAVTPVLPALTQTPGHAGTWEFGLAHWQVPGSSGGTIVGGKVWAHGSIETFSAEAAPGNPGTATGVTDLILAVTRSTPFAANQFMLPSAGLVTLQAGVSLSADSEAGGSVIVQMAGASMSVPFKFDMAGTMFVPVPLSRVFVPNAGAVPATVQLYVETAPVVAVRTVATQFQDMT